MSLDITLYEENNLICECGKVHKLGTEEVYETNITHNLNQMAEEAGIYKILWRPEELGITTAKDLIIGLTNGLERLTNGPTYYTQFNSSNGWGAYEVFVIFVREYLEACIKHPEAIIEISR